MNKENSSSNNWGMARVVFHAHKEKIFDLLEKGYSLKRILSEHVKSEVSYQAMAKVVRKHKFKKTKNDKIGHALVVKTASKSNDEAILHNKNISYKRDEPWDPSKVRIEDLI